MLLRFFVAGAPQTKGSFHIRHRWGPIVNGKDTCTLGLSEMSPGLAAWRRQIKQQARYALKASGQAPAHEGPVTVRLDFLFKRPKYHATMKEPPVHVDVRNRWDADKLTRAVLDALTDSEVIKDDGQVAVLVVRKLYDDRAGVRAMVANVGEEQW